ncbi:rhomboid family intramembrane serine protease [Rhizobium sp. NLR9b]|uniref:rhomboid family intramembrane serine protease n=1 Tax=unclassified Rhizobium TaxID=2613769 RepID=UPI001C8284A8|nr:MULTISPECIES: rhomboid family intramembrane serine protease [unclassified Rhizobium]MBX5225659.1 rhomboid family intramembrane serine protease [Rhizobium sp. NLR9b]MBX5286332.1 rhomboid family intramembrane serine protease [Rhizobium sp. NLR10b]
MKPKELRRSEYAYNKGKLLVVILIMFSIAAGAVFLGFHPPKDKNPYVIWFFSLLAAGFFGLLPLLLVPRLFSREPGMVISTEGVRLPIFPDQIVRWSAVRSFQRLQSKGSDSIVLHLDPAAAEALIRRGLAAKLPEWFVGSRLKVGIPLHMLRGRSNSIFNEFAEMAIEAFEAKWQALQEAGSIAEEEEDEVPEPGFDGARYPVFTYVLLAVLVAVYAGELAFGVEVSKAGSPSIRTLLVLGGTFRPSIVEGGEWWRLFTAPFMHGGIVHLASNCFCLWMAGMLFEQLIGWRWFAAIFFASALGGSIASVWINDVHTVGVGASGGIVGLFAAVIAGSIRFRSTPVASSLQVGAIQILVPSLLPFLSAAKEGQTIDYAGHFGGAVTGAALSLLLLTLWPRERSTPRFGAAAIAFSAAFVLIATGSLWPITDMRQFYVNDPMTNYFGGRYEQAATGFAALASQDPRTAPYYRLWRFMARTRGRDLNAPADLRAAAGEIDQAAWPYPIYRLFLHDLKPEELTAKAADSNQICEATFYVGEWYLFAGATQEARRKFEIALASCPTTFIEYDGARGELSKLDAK